MAKAAEAKDWAREMLVGLWASPLTVLTEDFDLDFQGLTYNVNYMIDGLKLDGLGHGHSEPWTLTVAERTASMEAFVNAVARRRPIYVHATDHSAAVTVDLVNFAADIGADAVMLHAPYEWAKTDTQIWDFFSYVAERSDIAIILLNTPHSGRLLQPELIAALAELPGICALKDGIRSFDASFRTWKLCGHSIVVSHPHEDDAIRSITEMGQPVQLGTSAAFLLQTPDFQPIRRYLDAARAGDRATAEAIYEALASGRKLWNEIYGALWSDSPEHPIVLEKAWMDQLGMRGGPVRRPLRNLEPGDARKFRERVAAVMAQMKAEICKLGEA